jgi:hypothetical protein
LRNREGPVLELQRAFVAASQGPGEVRL